jgi:L-2,4-diaminobutyrate decarboxylase
MQWESPPVKKQRSANQDSDISFDEYFLSPLPQSRTAYRAALERAVAILFRGYALLRNCYSGAEAASLKQKFTGLEVCPEEGKGLETTLDLVGRSILRHSVVVSDPACVGHLHCPPLIPALAAECLISATNQSMDSWDQAPAATYLEQRVIDWLAGALGLGSRADGIFTSGGTQSNILGLLLARDAFVQRRFGWRVSEKGLPPEAGKMRILTSANSHFSIQQSAAILGLGRDTVVPVGTDSLGRMDVTLAACLLDSLTARGLLPFVIVATAGTTDTGSIDPLSALADLAGGSGVWLHVDAAYGGALVLSNRYGNRLQGVGRADSVTVDFHKLFYQPISCSALLVRDRLAFEAIRFHTDYLNPKENEQAGVLDLVTKSIQTTRRFDGLKPFVSLHALGRRRLAAMIDSTVDLATVTAAMIREDPDLELAMEPFLNALVFRYHRGGVPDAVLDAVNSTIRNRLLISGQALLARTTFTGRIFLKITLLNPRTKRHHIKTILTRVKQVGNEALRVSG